MGVWVEALSLLFAVLLDASPCVAAFLISCPTTLWIYLCRRIWQAAIERQVTRRQERAEAERKLNYFDCHLGGLLSLDGIHNDPITYWNLHKSFCEVDATTLCFVQYASAVALCYNEISSWSGPSLLVVSDVCFPLSPKAVYFADDGSRSDATVVSSCHSEDPGSNCMVLGDVVLGGSQSLLYHFQLRNRTLLVSRSIVGRSDSVPLAAIEFPRDDQDQNRTAATDTTNDDKGQDAPNSSVNVASFTSDHPTEEKVTEANPAGYRDGTEPSTSDASRQSTFSDVSAAHAQISEDPRAQEQAVEKKEEKEERLANVEEPFLPDSPATRYPAENKEGESEDEAA